MPVSADNSRIIYDALKACGVRLMSALPETWLVHLIRMAEEDPGMMLVRLAKEEEGVGISAGAHFAGVKSAMLMQNHGFLASINGIVSFAHLYKIPLLMLISYRGTFGERDPWQTQGGNFTTLIFIPLWRRWRDGWRALRSQPEVDPRLKPLSHRNRHQTTQPSQPPPHRTPINPEWN